MIAEAVRAYKLSALLAIFGTSKYFIKDHLVSKVFPHLRTPSHTILAAEGHLLGNAVQIAWGMHDHSHSYPGFTDHWQNTQKDAGVFTQPCHYTLDRGQLHLDVRRIF